MAELLTPEEIERRATERGLSMKRVCAQAGIATTTFWRWRAGRSFPSVDVYRRLVDAVSEKAA